MLIAPLEIIVGREARANQTAKAAADGVLPPREARQAKKDQALDQDYLAFLARNVTTIDQFDAAMDQVNGNMRKAVSGMVLPLLPMPVQTAIRLRELSDES